MQCGNSERQFTLDSRLSVIIADLVLLYSFFSFKTFVFYFYVLCVTLSKSVSVIRCCSLYGTCYMLEMEMDLTEHLAEHLTENLAEHLTYHLAVHLASI